jgi:hypothetical protein
MITVVHRHSSPQSYFGSATTMTTARAPAGQ